MSRTDVEAPGTVAAGRALGKSQSIAILAPGTLPKRKNTVIAEVLSAALTGEVLTGMDGVFNASTTRLAAHVGDIETRYGWIFSRRYKVMGCRDGRVVTIVEYSLAPEVIEAAMQAGAADWCKAVRVARLALRAQAAKAKAAAEKSNSAVAMRRRAVASHGQSDLFGSGS